MTEWQTIDPLDEQQMTVHIEYTKEMGFVSAKGESCIQIINFRQHGMYKWIADNKCQPIIETHPPDQAYLPLFCLYGVCRVLCVAYLLWRLAKHYKLTEKVYYKIRKRKEKDLAESEVSEPATIATTATTQTSGGSSVLPVPQLISVQVFRGLIILLMIVFQGDCERFAILKASIWNGILPADYIYPWFLWSMGALFYLRYRAQLLLGSSRHSVSWQILLRSLRYMVLGFFLNTIEANNIPTVRIPGELQRYGLLHLVMFGVEVFWMKLDVEVDNLRRAKDLLDCWLQWLFMLTCVTVNLLITYLLPVPDCPTGYTGPGGLHMNSRYLNCTGGAARYIDTLLIGDDHMKELDDGNCYGMEKKFDPEGLLGTLNGCLTVFSGMQAVRIFVYYSRARHQIGLLLIWGLVQTLLGLSLCGFSKEEGPIPLNKNLWSLSFALLTSGVAFLLFAGLYVLVDLYHYWSGSPCFEAGLNTMLLFAGHIVLKYSFPFSWVPIDNTTYWEFLFMDIIKVAFWITISVICYKHNRIFLM